MSDSMLMELKNVECAFYVRKSRIAVRSVQVLHDVNFTLERGETLGVVGHNGAGKSTLLQVLAGILAPTGGELRKQHGLTVSLLTLQLGFSNELTGRENAVMSAMYLGHGRKEAERRLPGILDFAEIGTWVDEPLRTYSTGMRSRLGFAVAMEMQPDVMLIDETLGVGDAYFQRKSSEALLNKMRSGQTTVLVSHNDATIRALCNRVIWLHEGRVYREGSPAEVMDAYNDWIGSLKHVTAGRG